VSVCVCVSVFVLTVPEFVRVSPNRMPMLRCHALCHSGSISLHKVGSLAESLGSQSVHMD